MACAGRDENGRFVKGHKINNGRKNPNAGRKTDAEREQIHALIDANVSPDSVAIAWQRIDRILASGGRGWLEYFKFYCDRRYGRPDTFHQIEHEGDMLIRIIGGIAGTPTDTT